MSKVAITDDIRNEHSYICAHKIEYIKHLRRVRTSAAAKDVVLFLVDCANSDTGKCYPSMADIMAGTDLSEGTAKDGVSAAKRDGLIYAKKPWKGAQPDYFLAFSKAVSLVQAVDKDVANRMEIHPSSQMEIHPIQSDGNPSNTIMEHNHGTSIMEQSVSAGSRMPDGSPSDSSHLSVLRPLASSRDSSAVDSDVMKEKEDRKELINHYRMESRGEIDPFPIPDNENELEHMLKEIRNECGNLDDNWMRFIRRNLMNGELTYTHIQQAKRAAA